MVKTKECDPAVDAWRRVREAGVDDIEYLAAIEDFERAVPTTLRGISLKRRLNRARAATLADGDKLTWQGRVARNWYLQTIDQGLEQIPPPQGQSSELACRSRPTPTPRGAVPARSPKAAKPLG